MDLSSWTMQHRGSAIFQAGRTWWHATGLANTQSYAMEPGIMPKDLEVEHLHNVSSKCMIMIDNAWDFVVTTLTSFLSFDLHPCNCLHFDWTTSRAQHESRSRSKPDLVFARLGKLNSRMAILWVPSVVLGQSKPWKSWNLSSCADEIPWKKMPFRALVTSA